MIPLIALYPIIDNPIHTTVVTVNTPMNTETEYYSNIVKFIVVFSTSHILVHNYSFHLVRQLSRYSCKLLEELGQLSLKQPPVC